MWGNPCHPMADEVQETVPKTRPGWLIPATVAVIIEILANLGMIVYLLYIIPSRCATLAASTNGRVSCSLEPGAYVIAGICGILILAGIVLLYIWHTNKCEILMKPGCKNCK